jgi:hypothetical protein
MENFRIELRKVRNSIFVYLQALKKALKAPLNNIQ